LRTSGRIRSSAKARTAARKALVVKYSQERQQFGKPIAEFQAVQFELAARTRLTIS
jgi:alkylation response protein AidB-like acyl-CoA dehydrogenase